MSISARAPRPIQCRAALSLLLSRPNLTINPRYASTTSHRATAQSHGAEATRAESLQWPKSALSVLPFSALVRSYAVTAMSSSPLLLHSSMRILNAMLQSRNFFTNVNRNPLLSWLLKRTFYDQFCAGENKTEVQEYIKGLKTIGYNGTILEYALEVVDDRSESLSSEDKIYEDIETWRKSVLESVEIVNPGDFIGFKWSGMGAEAMRIMKNKGQPSSHMARAMTEVCEAALAKNVFLLPAAEMQKFNLNNAVDAWNLDLMQRYNKSGHAVVYSTYQAYLKSTPSTLARHLAHAKANNYTLGVKLVRGAYLQSDIRSLIWDTKEETDNAYDSLALSLLNREYNAVLRPNMEDNKTFPDVELMLATHNDVSVTNARKIRDRQVAQKQKRIPLVYAQLQGMADELSCELVQAARVVRTEERVANQDVPRVFKHVSWGTTDQCLTFLLRRAAENEEAMARTIETKRAMGRELRKRLGLARV